jgi:hypothetical protein
LAFVPRFLLGWVSDTLDAVLWRGRSLADAQRSGRMTIEGDKAAVERFVRLFPMPEPAAAVASA